MPKRISTISDFRGAPKDLSEFGRMDEAQLVMYFQVELLSENPCEAEYAITVGGRRVGRAVVPIELARTFEELFEGGSEPC